MRLWSLHPKYLDAKGLVALWRESLLAQNVLRGNTKGYRNHPQLVRFKAVDNPLGAVAVYLRQVLGEASHRGYNFDSSKIAKKNYTGRIPVTRGQLEYEFTHLLNKLKLRDPEMHARLIHVKRISPHPLFRAIRGDVEPWEVV